MIRWFARNPIAANFLMLAILIAGAYTAFFKVPLEIEPSWKEQKVEVRITYNGATAKDIEKAILLPVEAALKDVNGIKRLHCRAYSSWARISIDTKDSQDPRLLLEEVQTRIEAIRTLPPEIERPKYYIPDSARYSHVLWLTITGEMTEGERLEVARRVRDDLLELGGISNLRIWPDKDPEIGIEADLEKLEAYNMGFDDLAEAVRRYSVDLPAGTISSDSGSLSIRTRGQAYHTDEFKRIPVRASNGAEITVGDVAKVEEFLTGRHQNSFEYNGKPGISIGVLRSGDESAIDISDKIHDYVAKSKGRFPEGVELWVGSDDSERIRGRLGTLAMSLLQGCGLILLILGLFLRPKLAFWVLMGIPVSFAGAVLCMPSMGISANITSLFGFLIALGLVVDDAIVTGENIYAKVKDGMDSVQAAIEGAEEVAVPVTFGALTTIMAFLPLYFFEGGWGQFARQIPPIVGTVLLFSLLESKLVLPSHLTTLGKRKAARESNPFRRLQGAIARKLESFVEKVYQPSLEFALANRLAVVSTFVAGAMALAGYCMSGRLGFVSIPQVDRPSVEARFHMPNDGSEEANLAFVKRVYKAGEDLKPEYMDGDSGQSIVQNIFKMEWQEGADSIGYWINLELLPQRKRQHPGPKNDDIVNRWRELVGEIPEDIDLKIKSRKSGGMDRDEDEDVIELELRGPDSKEKREVARAIAKHLETYEGIANSRANVNRNGQQELEFKLKPRAVEVGLTQRSLARQIRQAFYGEEAQRIQRDTDEVKVMVRLPEEARESLHTLERLRIRLPDGTEAPVSTVADIEKAEAPWHIYRLDGAQVTQVSAQPKDKRVDIYRIAKKATPEIQKIVNEVPGLSFRFTGQIAENEETRQKTIFGFVALLVGIYAMLAIPFKSLVQPVYVLVAVPFGLIGAVLGHIVLGVTPSYLSLFGILALSGVVVNDSLVLVDFINRHHRSGNPLAEAVSMAGARRFRPIFLTSATTFLGLLPLLMDSSQQAQFLIPMAVSLAAGILVATLITLYLLPCILLIGDDCEKATRKFMEWYAEPFKS